MELKIKITPFISVHGSIINDDNVDYDKQSLEKTFKDLKGAYNKIKYDGKNNCYASSTTYKGMVITDPKELYVFNVYFSKIPKFDRHKLSKTKPYFTFNKSVIKYYLKYGGWLYKNKEISTDIASHLKLPEFIKIVKLLENKIDQDYSCIKVHLRDCITQSEHVLKKVEEITKSYLNKFKEIIPNTSIEIVSIK